MSISAIVPVWNGRELLARLLDSLDAQTLRADEVIAVDNGSTDGAPDIARSRGARVIAMGRNAGFAKRAVSGSRSSIPMSSSRRTISRFSPQPQRPSPPGRF
jgi:glycosyltransferase involved in cell wall biosynthesis